MLSEEQIEYFNIFGMIILRNILSKEEVWKLNVEWDAKLTTTTDGGDPKKKYIMSWPNLGPETPYTGSLLEDPRVNEIVESIYPNGYYGISCNSVSKAGETPWHSDSDIPLFQGVKVVTYLQKLNGDNGALRVIPGSHRYPLHDEIKKNKLWNPGVSLKGKKKVDDTSADTNGGLAISEVPAFICATNPGDLIVFDLRVWHASTGGSNDRRLLSMNFIKQATRPEEDDAINKQVQLSKKVRANRAKESFTNPMPEYPPDWIANPDNRSKRQCWIDWLRGKGFF
jgi:hypothetical protein